MSRTRKLPFALLVLLHATLVCADEPHILVALFESKTGDRDLCRKMSVICAEEAMRTGGLRYISPTEYLKIVTGSDKVKVDRPPDPAKEYSTENMDYLEKLSQSDKNSLDRFAKALETADIFMGGKIQRNGPLVKVEIMVTNPRENRDYTAVVESGENGLEEKVRQAAAKLLIKMSKPVKVYADKLIDKEKSVVTYAVKAADGTDITIEMDYTGDRPDPEMQNVKILSPYGIEDKGAVSYWLKSDERRPIEVEYGFKGTELDYVKVGTPIPDPSSKDKQHEILTVKSNAGYALKFEFVWNKGEMESVKLYPELNPFGDYD